MINFDLNKQFDENCAYEFVGFLFKLKNVQIFFYDSF